MHKHISVTDIYIYIYRVLLETKQKSNFQTFVYTKLYVFKYQLRDF